MINNFLQIGSKLLKNNFRMIKIIFFPDFGHFRGWVGGSDQILKIPDLLFEPFPKSETCLILVDFAAEISPIFPPMKNIFV